MLRNKVTEEEIAKIIERWTGIPTARLMEGERDKLLHLEDTLHKRVVGQDETLIDVLAALSDFVKVASEWAESASKAEVETFTQIYPQKEEAVKKAVEKAITLEEVRSVLANLSRSGQKETVLKLLQKYGGSRLSEVPPERYAALFADAQEAAHAE